jgi:hypothetical protein
MRFMFYIDGEAIILKQALDPEVLAEFSNGLIDVLKGPPSASAIHQAADRSNTFRDLKKGH